MKTIKHLFFVLVVMCLASCKEEEKLPILGEKTIDTYTGQYNYYKTPDFKLTNQFNEKVRAEDYQGKIQVVDFFFTSCPTICPQMTNHLKSVEQAFLQEDRVGIISISIDTKNDTPERLLEYSKNYDINTDRWNLLTGCDDIIFELAKDYKVRAFDDSSEKEINLIHDGTFVLVDGQQRIRGYYNGLEGEDTERLINDIKILLKEFPNENKS